MVDVAKIYLYFLDLMLPKGVHPIHAHQWSKLLVSNSASKIMFNSYYHFDTKYLVLIMFIETQDF